jgi:hypothetical protein
MVARVGHIVLTNDLGSGPTLGRRATIKAHSTYPLHPRPYGEPREKITIKSPCLIDRCLRQHDTFLSIPTLRPNGLHTLFF